MRRAMDINEVEILAGRAKSVSAKHYAMYELDKLTEAYANAWGKFRVQQIMRFNGDDWICYTSKTIFKISGIFN